MTKKISILGSTGSIGTQTLDVVSKNLDQYEIEFITTNTQIDQLYEQIKKFNPKFAVICNEESYKLFNQKYQTNSTEILGGYDSICEISKNKVDLTISALVGFSGVVPTLNSIKSGNKVALANKETLVSAGNLIMKAAKEFNSEIIAIDSEHSAILQCLVGEELSSIEKIILTASGGPFRTYSKEDFKKITIKEALNHPNWKMGPKITIDSASMMNKGLEVIEAYWLFGCDISQIEVIIHPESIIHSLVLFKDKSIKAQLGLPDMRIPISYALNYPKRMEYEFETLDLTKIAKLHFEKPNFKNFKCLDLAFQVMKYNPSKAVILNAANEVAVDLFLNGKIDFNQIPILIEKALNKFDFEETNNIEDIININLETRNYLKV